MNFVLPYIRAYNGAFSTSNYVPNRSIIDVTHGVLSLGSQSSKLQHLAGSNWPIVLRLAVYSQIIANLDAQRAEKDSIPAFFDEISEMLTNEFQISVDAIGDCLIEILMEQIAAFDEAESNPDGCQEESIAEAVSSAVQIIQIMTRYVTRIKGQDDSLIIKYLRCLVDDQTWQPGNTLLNHGHIQIRRAFTLSVVDLKYAAEETVEAIISQSLTESQAQIVEIYLAKKRALLDQSPLNLSKQSKSANIKPKSSRSPLLK